MDLMDDERPALIPDGAFYPDLNLYITGSGQRLYNIHDEAVCAGRPCTIHSPSGHHMRAFPTFWRADAYKMERICPHGIGHPDPDELAWHMENGRAWMSIHGCDGCCAETKSPTGR